MAKKKVEKKEDSFASKLGIFFNTVWHYTRTGRDYFWIGYYDCERINRGNLFR